VKTSTHTTAPVELDRLLQWAEKEKSKAFDEWLKQPPNKNAPSAQYHISRWDTMKDVVKKIKSEIKNASKGKKGMTNENVIKLLHRVEAAEERAAAAEDALRDLALFFSCGGYNDCGLVPFDPLHYAKKIKDASIKQIG
jgi:hypothetical protein